MTTQLNITHDPALRSWVAAANRDGCDFPIQNLPFGIFRCRNSHAAWRAGVAIGEQILDLRAALENGAFDQAGEAAQQAARAAASTETLNPLMALDASVWSALRQTLSALLREGAAQRPLLESCLVAQAAAEYALPAQVGDYTDFYTSIHHAVTVGSLFRPDNPLLPNYKWVPIGYHGRASSVIVSGQPFRRPRGQTMDAGSDIPVVGPSRRLDYEMEVGVWMGQGNAPGEAIDIAQAESRIFGLGLLNDWSARDIQAWEYQPLGPFLGKNFATTVSPWIVTLEALAPYRAPWTRAAADPQPLSYLDAKDVRAAGAIDLHLEVLLQTDAMRRQGVAAERLSLGNLREAYWTLSQLVAHHTVGGCNLRAGDLLGSGTMSGPTPESAGSLLELTRGGKYPIRLANGETRGFLEDGDTVVLRGWAARPGLPRIGLGEAVGLVLPAGPAATG